MINLGGEMAKTKKKTKGAKGLSHQAYEIYGNDDFIIMLAAAGIVLLLAAYFFIRLTR